MGVRPEYFMATGPDSPYYTTGARRPLPAGSDERLQAEELPAGWLVQQWTVWEGWTPRDWRPRLQGWKIHVSASVDCAVETLRRVTRICVRHSVAFKFLPTESFLAETNGKQADRGSSGKFVTIYPDDDGQLAELLAELEEALAGQQGPYILSDLRYGGAPVYVRYGGIMALHYPDERDRPVSAVVAGPALTLTADDRKPRFSIPDGVELPECLRAAHERSRQGTESRLRDFKAVAALHFSNAGGVYKATLPDGTRRVLREARPHTGLDGRGRDAITRQRDEETTLRELQGIPGVQRLIDSFQAWEHRYLELEYVEGRTLSAWVVQHSAYDVRDGGARKRAFAERAEGIVRRLVDTVARIHAAGWCIGDLHPGNVIVTESDDVVILDLEDATRIDAERAVGFRVFEFCGPEELTAEQADWYAVSRSIMLMYVSDWELEVIAPAFWDEAMRRVRREFGDANADQLDEVLGRFPHPARHLLAPSETVGLWPSRPDAETAIQALDEGIEWSRQYSATGSFPGDCLQEGDVTESFGFGRAGVTWTRLRLGRPVPDGDLAALIRAADDAEPEATPGLLTGLAGIALALSDAGRHDAAAAAAGRALMGAQARHRLDLFGGLAGVLLAGFEVARAAGDDDLLSRVLATYERLHHGLRDGGSGLASLTHRRGLHFGLTGLALTDIAAHLAGGDPRPLDRAIERLADEVGACFVTSDGDMMVRDVDNNRALPYIEWGSAGVWAVVQVAERLSRQRLLDDDQRTAFARACSADFYVYPGLDHGRAGVMAVLSAAGDDQAAEVERQRDFLLDTVLHRDRMAFSAGDGFLRLSSDLATGAAGVALGLHCAHRRRPFDWLPLSAPTAGLLNSLPIPAADGLAPDELLTEVSSHG